MTDEKIKCDENAHVNNSLVLGKDHCGFCYDIVMDFREQLGDLLEREIEQVIIDIDTDDNGKLSNHQIYRAVHKIAKMIRGD